MTVKHCESEILGLWNRWDQENRMMRAIARYDQSGIGVSDEQAKNWRWLNGQLKSLELAHGFRTYSEAMAQLLLGDGRGDARDRAQEEEP